MTARPLMTDYDDAALALAPDASDVADLAIERDAYVRIDEPGRVRPPQGTVECVMYGQVLVSNEYGATRWVSEQYITVILSAAAARRMRSEANAS